MNEAIGDRIAKARIDRELSKTELARLTGVSPNTISMYENGRRVPSTKMIISLAVTLKVSTDYLLMGRCGRTADLSGLEEKEYLAIMGLAEILREKNEQLGIV